jgi:hypothetical protein
MSAPEQVTVVIAGIDLVLAVSLLLAILWRDRGNAISVLLIVGPVLGFGIALAIGQISDRSNPTPPADLERRVGSLETEVARLQHAKIPEIEAHIVAFQKRADTIESDIKQINNTQTSRLVSNITTINKNITTISNRLTNVININNLKEEIPPVQPSSAQVAIGSVRLGQRSGKPVVYMTVHNVGKTPATISGDVSFCPVVDKVEPQSKDCTSAPQNGSPCSHTFVCSGQPIPVGGQSRELFATLPTAYLDRQKSFRILIKLCDAISGKCDISLTKSTFDWQPGSAGPRGKPLDISDFVARPDYDPKQFS